MSSPCFSKIYRDPIAFKSDVFAFMCKKEAQNCLGISICETLVTSPTRYPEFYLAGFTSAEADPVGVAWQTPPHPMGITDIPMGGIDELIRFAQSLGHKIPGIVGPVDSVEAFKDKWLVASGATVKSKMAQRIYQLDQLESVHLVKGQMRAASEADLDLLEAWSVQFAIDCHIEHTIEVIKEAVLHAVKTQSRFLWESDGIPLSMAGVGGPTPHGARVSWVYTPAALRGKGYGSAIVAAVSQRQFDQGKKFCFLYTDLSNPTSNGIYQRMGYRPVCDSVHYNFEYSSH